MCLVGLNLASVQVNVRLCASVQEFFLCKYNKKSNQRYDSRGRVKKSGIKCTQIQTTARKKLNVEGGCHSKEPKQTTINLDFINNRM